MSTQESHTIFSIGGKFRPVSKFTELHALTLASLYDLGIEECGGWWFCLVLVAQWSEHAY